MTEFAHTLERKICARWGGSCRIGFTSTVKGSPPSCAQIVAPYVASRLCMYHIYIYMYLYYSWAHQIAPVEVQPILGPSWSHLGPYCSRPHSLTQYDQAMGNPLAVTNY